MMKSCFEEKMLRKRKERITNFYYVAVKLYLRNVFIEILLTIKKIIRKNRELEKGQIVGNEKNQPRL